MRLAGVAFVAFGLGIFVGLYCGIRLAEQQIRERLERAKRYQTRGTL